MCSSYGLLRVSRRVFCFALMLNYIFMSLAQLVVMWDKWNDAIALLATLRNGGAMADSQFLRSMNAADWQHAFVQSLFESSRLDFRGAAFAIAFGAIAARLSLFCVGVLSTLAVVGDGLLRRAGLAFLRGWLLRGIWVSRRCGLPLLWRHCHGEMT